MHEIHWNKYEIFYQIWAGISWKHNLARVSLPFLPLWPQFSSDLDHFLHGQCKSFGIPVGPFLLVATFGPSGHNGHFQLKKILIFFPVHFMHVLVQILFFRELESFSCLVLVTGPRKIGTLRYLSLLVNYVVPRLSTAVKCLNSHLHLTVTGNSR